MFSFPTDDKFQLMIKHVMVFFLSKMLEFKKKKNQMDFRQYSNPPEKRKPPW